jgi:hypothetical protein
MVTTKGEVRYRPLFYFQIFINKKGMKKIKWFFTELMNMYSVRKSYFSKKRIESGVAFVIAQWGMIFFLLEKHLTLTMGEFLLWATTEFAVAGWMIHKIQKEKTTSDTDETENPQ